MFRFFRHLRKGLIEEGKLLRYSLYAVGEIILVVLGILIALQINTWNKDRVDRDLERTFLKRVVEDLNEDIENFTLQKETGRIGLESLSEAIILIHQVNTEEDAFKFNELYDLAWIEDLTPQYTTYSELESTGQLNLIQNEELRLAILKHYAYYKQMETEFDRMFVWHKTIARGMDAETSILKYVTSYENIFPASVRSEIDWSFLNDPKSPKFQMTETAVAATSYWISDAMTCYSEIIPRTKTLKEQVEEVLKK